MAIIQLVALMEEQSERRCLMAAVIYGPMAAPLLRSLTVNEPGRDVAISVD